MMMSRKTIIAGVGFVFLVAMVYGLLISETEHEYESEQFLMDTLVNIKVYGEDAVVLEKATAEAFSEMRRVAALVDRFPEKGTSSYEKSDICRINSQAGIEPVRVAEDVFSMLKAAQEYSQLSEGAFGVTVAPLLDIWGFGKATQQVPTVEEINEALKLADEKKVVLDENKQTVFLQEPGMRLDLGAVAKGYAVEKAAEVLQEEGIKRAMINAGGNIKVIGENRDNSSWRIGIQDPRNPSEIIGVLDLKDEAVATSGDYIRYFEEKGIKYHHLLSLETGYPANMNICVTVISPEAGEADLLSTVLFLLDSEEALALAEGIENTEAFIVTSDRRIVHTSGLADKLEITAKEGYYYD